MGLFSNILGGIGANKGADRYASGLTSAYGALQTGADEYEKRVQPTAQIATDTMQRLSDVLLKGDMSKFTNSPDYNFVRDEGLKGIQANAAAQGTLMSGRTLKDLEKYGSGLASGEYTNFLSRLGSLFQSASPSYEAYSQIPYMKAQDSANFYSSLGASQRDAQMSKYNAIGSGLDSFKDAIMGGMTGGMGGMGGGSVAPWGSTLSNQGLSMGYNIPQNTGGFNWQSLLGGM